MLLDVQYGWRAKYFAREVVSFNAISCLGGRQPD
jgi:hypothetical protein